MDNRNRRYLHQHPYARNSREAPVHRVLLSQGWNSDPRGYEDQRVSDSGFQPTWNPSQNNCSQPGTSQRLMPSFTNSSETQNYQNYSRTDMPRSSRWDAPPFRKEMPSSSFERPWQTEQRSSVNPTGDNFDRPYQTEHRPSFKPAGDNFDRPWQTEHRPSVNPTGDNFNRPYQTEHRPSFKPAGDNFDRSWQTEHRPSLNPAGDNFDRPWQTEHRPSFNPVGDNYCEPSHFNPSHNKFCPPGSSKDEPAGYFDEGDYDFKEDSEPNEEMIEQESDEDEPDNTDFEFGISASIRNEQTEANFAKLQHLDLKEEKHLSEYIDYLLATLNKNLELFTEQYNNLVKKFAINGKFDNDKEKRAYLHCRREINNVCGIFKKDITTCNKEHVRSPEFLIDTRIVYDLHYQPRIPPVPSRRRPQFDTSGLPDVNMLPHLLKDVQKGNTQFRRIKYKKSSYRNCKNSHEYLQARLNCLEKFYNIKNSVFMLLSNPELKMAMFADIAKAHQMAVASGNQSVANDLKRSIGQVLNKKKFDIESENAIKAGATYAKNKIKTIYARRSSMEIRKKLKQERLKMRRANKKTKKGKGNRKRKEAKKKKKRQN